MSTMTAQPLQARAAREYLPESDGKPMAETDSHRKLMMGLLEGLEDFFRDDPLVYVSGNIFFYYLDEDGERQSVSPDVMVIRGVPKKNRRYYKLDDEGRVPEVIIELMSRSTKLEDLGSKKVLYASLGVREYFVFDPLKEVSSTMLRGFRLEQGEYTPMVGARLRSEALGLELLVENESLRLFDPLSKKYLRTHEEAEAAYREAEGRIVIEAAARRLAEVSAEEEATARRKAEALATQEAAARRNAEALAAQESAARKKLEAELQSLREALARAQSQQN